MSFKYEASFEKRGALDVYTLKSPGFLQAEIVPQLGNNCFSLRQSLPIFEQVAYETFSQKPTSFGLPILFPFPNRVRNGQFHFLGQSYEVTPNRHGFVRDKQWDVISVGTSDDEAWIQSAFDATLFSEQILSQYPFPFYVEVTYRLRNEKFEADVLIKNKGEQSMPCGFGFHPYFRHSAQATIQVPARKRWELYEGLPTGVLMDVDSYYDLRHPKRIKDLALDDVFNELIEDLDGFTRCIIDYPDENSQTVVEFDSKKFPNVVVYTPPLPRQAICIEPYTCPTDAFNLTHQGISCNLMVLHPNEHVNFSIRIYTRSSEEMRD